MKEKTHALKRNQRMDLYRGIAIYGVIAIHVLFPGFVGEWVRALARYAVPFFFLTAGYFNFNAQPRALGRRALRTLKELAVGSGLYLLLGCFLAIRRGENVFGWVGSFFRFHYLKEFIQYHTVPFPYAWQMWFMGAMVMVYLLWWAFTTLTRAAGKQFPYDAFAVGAAVVLVFHLILGEGAALLGKTVDNRILRNAFLDGLPFFALGSWAAWRRFDIKQRNIPWHYLILGGAGVSLAESMLLGRQEIYLGTMVMLVGLMGRCIRYRRVSENKVTAFLMYCGRDLTLTIFTVHMLVIALIRELSALDWLEGLTWILPIVVAVLSTLIALGAVRAKGAWKKRRKGK